MDESKQILIAITQLQENVKTLSEQVKEISKIGQNVVEATQSVKSAHNRIDDLKEDFRKDLQVEKEARKKLEDHITWLWRAVGTSAISCIFGLIVYFVTK